MQEWYGTERNNVYRGANYASSTLSATVRGNNDGSASETIGFRMSIILDIPSDILHQELQPAL